MGRRRVALVIACATACALLATSCAIVPKNRRAYLADPTMQPTDDALRAKTAAKLHTAREGAAGGDGEPAGGGCGCSN